MKDLAQKFFVLVLLVALAGCGVVYSETKAGALKTPSVISNNMVLQAGQDINLWGWCTPGSKVTVSFAGEIESTQTAASGRWDVTLDSLKASFKNRELKIVSGSESITVKNVLVGEVWVASGQSNMWWTLSRTDKTKEEIAKLDHPNIRMITFPLKKSTIPMKNIVAKWVPINGKSGPSASAVAFHFANKLQKELNVPVGIISTSWGGTRIEPWTPAEGFEAVSDSPKVKAMAKGVRERGAADKPASGNNRVPGVLYNAMIYPIIGYGIKGAIWYQGEANMGEGLLYEKKMQALIWGWRAVWKQGDFPFYHVQLAPYGPYSGERLGGLWEAQYHSIKSIKNTGMAVTTDISNLKNIHPKNKTDVGHRLAFWALAKDYGKDIPYSGPLYEGYKISGKTMRISFKHAKSGLAFKGKAITDVFIQGEGDKAFIKANTAIEGSLLVVTHPEGKTPVAVRMGWNKNAEPNLMNKEGLPATPFRTDK
jgi:sialate O-acetylesterase